MKPCLPIPEFAVQIVCFSVLSPRSQPFFRFFSDFFRQVATLYMHCMMHQLVWNLVRPMCLHMSTQDVLCACANWYLGYLHSRQLYVFTFLVRSPINEGASNNHSVSSCRVLWCVSVLCPFSPGAPRLRVACLNGGVACQYSQRVCFSKHIRFRYYYCYCYYYYYYYYCYCYYYYCCCCCCCCFNYYCYYLNWH